MDRKIVVSDLKDIADILIENGYGGWAVSIGEAIALLKEQPDVIRCEDCKHHGKDTCGAAAGIAYPPPDEWFCADGKRKD